jgi:SAM-dependent methyltransferase
MLQLFRKPKIVFQNKGYCPTCSSHVTFYSTDAWLRDHYACSHCGSIPRDRALMTVIETYFPNWKNLTIHESSPVKRGASMRLLHECKGYTSSQYFPGVKSGEYQEKVLCENLESLSFSADSIDLHITQDVMEHVFHPAVAFREIARTLKPGGAHIFTVPLVNKNNPTKIRSKLVDGQIKYLEPPVYHAENTLVTFDWGFDICQYIFDACGLFTHIVTIDDLSKGIRAEFIEVLITIKPKISSPSV